MEQTPHVAVLPSPGLGHLIPLSELASRLVYRHNFLVTLIIPTTTSPPNKAQKPVLESLSNGVNYIFLPPVSFEDLPTDTKSETKIILTMTRSLTSIRATIKSLSEKTRLVSLIVDPFGTDAFDIAKEFNVPPYLFFSSNAMNLSFGFYFPKLDGMVVGEFRDVVDPVLIPGCVPVHGRDLVDPVQDRSNVAYKLFSQLLKRFNLVEGILLNSFMELEEGAIKALQVEELGRPPVYPIGPLVKTGSGEERSECVDWLDNQPSGSVLFISFGSGGTLSSDQINELAFGLEMSGQRFIWVVKRPNNKVSNGTYFSDDESENNSLEFLPKGFLDRTKGVGLVVPDWAPQVEILAHSSIGCFVTHCGWNSILESIAHGVPMIAWPLYAEQRMNAVLLTDDLRVALRVTSDDNGLVRRDAIEKVVKEIMEEEKGNAIRNKIEVLKDAGTKVLGEDGSSTKSLSNLVIKWKIKRSIN